MAESLIYDLCKAVGGKVLEEGCLLLGVPEEAKKLTTNLKKIEVVLKAAEERELEAGVKEWIRELKDVAYDIENVLDDWSIAQLQMKDQFDTSSQHGNSYRPKADQVCFTCIPAPSFCFKQTKSRHEIASTIKNINSRLDEIYESKKKFKFPKGNTSINEVPRRETTTSYEEFIVVQSQGEDKDRVVKNLVHGDFKSSAADRIPIISIVGMGGIGKTTLARLVYDDEAVKGHFPNNVIWVCVSNTFNALNVAKGVAHGFRVRLTDDCDLQYVLTEIENSIKGRKFLIVLDDVWEDSEGKWGAILKCLAKGDTQGSRILMTTRNSDFSLKMGAVFALHVGVLSETDAWSLFCYYAFPADSKLLETVEDIAQKLVKKCDGLPLALQVLGRHMATKTTRSQWHVVYTSKIWETDFGEKVFNSLALSYLELRSEAKRCLAFCSVFPKDTVMSKNELIRLWMAQGYLQEREASQMEDIGEECFDSLLRRSFFQVARPDVLARMGILPYNENDTYVVMHDIVHDFAHYISGGEVVILDSSVQMPNGGQILRHLVLNGKESNCLYSSFDRKALRSIFLYKYPKEFLKDFFLEKSYIRALMIRDESTELHAGDLKGIGKLEHLRFISLSSCNLTVLPEEICSLSYLQTLDLNMCYNLKSLPKKIGRLTCLRHLLFDNSYRDINSLPKGLGKLRFLQTLSYFLCGNLDSNDCSSLEDSGDLNDLRGHLCLDYLNQVAQVNEATSAQLHMKKHIRQLTLQFGEGSALLQSDVLEALEPAKENIEFLRISRYQGRSYPRWISQLRYLKEINLNVVNMDSLPELGTLLCLEKLRINTAEEVKRVGAEFFGTCTGEDKVFFRKLTTLEFSNMHQWEHWEGPKQIMGCCFKIMPLLCSLTLNNTGLRSLPRFLEDVPLQILYALYCHLPPIECMEVDYAKKWRIGDVVLPETLKETSISWVSEAPVNNPAEASKEVRQPHLEFDLSKMNACLRFVTRSVPRWVTDLTYLRKIEFGDHKNVCLPAFGLMPSLEELTREAANNVEKVGNEFLGISNNNRGLGGGGGDENKDRSDGRGAASTASFTAFPRLKKLRFIGMSSWKTWEDPVHKNGDLVIMPVLCHLEFQLCDKLKCLPHFFEAVPLKKLRVVAESLGSINKLEVEAGSGGSMLKIRDSTTIAENEPAPQMDIRELELESIRHKWALDWAKYCVGPRKLRLSMCDAASLAALEMLPTLEILYLDDIFNIRRIGKEVTWISSLKELRLFNMRHLEEWEDPSSQLQPSSSEMGELSRNGNDNDKSAAISSIPRLRILSVCSCSKLKALPGFLKSTPLEELKIVYCDALATWWANEAGEDWRNWISRIPKFEFMGYAKNADGTTNYRLRSDR